MEEKCGSEEEREDLGEDDEGGMGGKCGSSRLRYAGGFLLLIALLKCLCMVIGGGGQRHIEGGGGLPARW